MKPSQILLTICLTTSLGLAGCNLSSPPRAPADSSATPASIATIPSTPSTAMPLPTLPAGRQPLAVETPVTITITTTREPARAERIALVFQLRGGFAGKNDMWTIYQSGLIRSNKGTDQHVDPQIVQTLLTEIDKLG